MTDYIVTARGFCCAVITDKDERIVDAAPMLQRFCGQPVENLRRWVNRLDGTVKTLAEAIEDTSRGERDAALPD